jgi:hypothetical protein
MHVYARAAVDQEALCAGFSPASTSQYWERKYRARHDSVTDAMTRRYGAQWQQRYARLLRLLEIRFGLAQGRDG